MPWGFIIRGVLAWKRTQSYWLVLSLYPGDVSIMHWQVFVKSNSSVLWQGWLESFVAHCRKCWHDGYRIWNSAIFQSIWPILYALQPHFLLGHPQHPRILDQLSVQKEAPLNTTLYVVCVCAHKSACVSAHTRLYLPRGSRRGQRTVFRSWFFHSILGTKLRLSRLSSRYFYPLSQLTGPIPHFWKVIKSTLC